MRPKICLFFSLFLFYNETFSQTSYPIIPYPNKLVEAEGEFEFNLVGYQSYSQIKAPLSN